MRRWIPRSLYAMLLGVSLPASLFAQQPAPPAPLPQAAGAPGAPGAPAVVYVPVLAGNPYLAATPYNPTVVSQTVPNPQLNRAEFTLPCNIPNQNLSPYTPTRPEFGGGGCGAGGGLFRGACSHPGSCATCCNTANFIFGSSRSFFGESSRDFFERPPSVDGIKHCPNKYAPGGGAAGGCGCGGH